MSKKEGCGALTRFKLINVGIFLIAANVVCISHDLFRNVSVQIESGGDRNFFANLFADGIKSAPESGRLSGIIRNI